MSRGCTVLLSSSIPVLALLAGCSAGPTAAGGWEREVVYDVGRKLGCCAVGDLEPTPGPELAIVDAAGGVHIARADGGGGRQIAQVGGEMIQCAVGDADLGTAGLEIVVVGMQQGEETPAGPGRAHVLSREGDDWVATPVFDDDALLHAVAVVEGEVFVGGYSRRLFRLVRTPTGEWRASEIARLPGAAKNAVALPGGGGVVVACTDGSLVRVARSGAGWSSEVVHKRLEGRARLAVSGDDLLVADDDGELWLVPADGEPERIHAERQKLRGAFLGDLDGDPETLEAATAGYGRRVWVFARDPDGGGWQAGQISEEPDRIHHLTGADLDDVPGAELVTVGFAGEVVVFRRP